MKKALIITMFFTNNLFATYDVTNMNLGKSMNKFGVTRFDDRLLNHPGMTGNVGEMMRGYIIKSQFNHRPRIEKASSIGPSGNNFNVTDELLKELFEYEPCFTIRPLHTLNLSGCENLTDDHIKSMCKNPFFYRLKNINLEGTGVTHIGLQYILESLIGSIREIPQESATYGMPITVVNVAITSRQDPPVKSEKVFSKRNITITYEKLDGSESSFRPASGALKELRLAINLPCAH
jgi:hypothetical protein